MVSCSYRLQGDDVRVTWRPSPSRSQPAPRLPSPPPGKTHRLHRASTEPGAVGRRARQLHLDEVLEGKPGLEALGVQANKLDHMGIAFLRRYRTSAYYDAPAEVNSRENQAALRVAAEGEDSVRPHSAY